MDKFVDVRSITNSILDGSAILFVGAGLSFLTKNKEGKTLPNGERIKIELHTATNTKNTYPLEKISGFYVKKFGSAKLFEYLGGFKFRSEHPRFDRIV